MKNYFNFSKCKQKIKASDINIVVPRFLNSDADASWHCFSFWCLYCFSDVEHLGASPVKHESW